jgi:hypothetical protein
VTDRRLHPERRSHPGRRRSAGVGIAAGGIAAVRAIVDGAGPRAGYTLSPRARPAHGRDRHAGASSRTGIGDGRRLQALPGDRVVVKVVAEIRHKTEVGRVIVPRDAGEVRAAMVAMRARSTRRPGLHRG